MTEPYLTDATLDAIAFLTGAALSAMLGLMQYRVDRAAGRASGYLLMWALGFIWTFGNFLRSALWLAGVGPDSAGTKLAETFAWSCTLLGPIAIARLLQAGIGTDSRASRRFQALAWGVSSLNLLLLLRANATHGFHLEDSWYPATSFFLALPAGVIALLIYVSRPRTAPSKNRPRWFAPAALLFAAIHTSSILLTMLFPDMPGAIMTTLNLVGRHWTIPWSVLIAVSLAQAHFADIVLKRSLWLLTSMAVATLLAVHVFDVAPGPHLLGTALVTAALMLVAPRVLRALEALVDKVILGRPDFAQARASLEQAFRRATDADQLIAAALESLRDTLRVDARWKEPDGLTTANPLASVPVNCRDRPARLIEITATHQARTLMQQELAFLGDVRRRLEQCLDALHFEQEQRALHLREERLKRLLTEAELKALRTQVDPHFLFNTLNTIADLISMQPQQAERMTERLAECFRYALAKHARDLSTLDEELGFARQYLEIEQVRFGDRLRVQLSRGDALGDEAVPSLLLQPLLENAIRHGLAPVREGGCVTVQAQRDGERLRLIIEDDGVGLRSSTSPGIGLRNVQERLRTLYSQAAEFLIGARPGGRGTMVTIVIPLVLPVHAH